MAGHNYHYQWGYGEREREKCQDSLIRCMLTHSMTWLNAVKHYSLAFHQAKLRWS